MKISAFILFLSIVLVIYSAVNYYIFIRGWQALSGTPALRPAYIVIYSVLFLSYIAGRILMHTAPGAFCSVMIWTGSFWLAFMLYIFLFIVLLDVSRLLSHWFHLYPAYIIRNYDTAKLVAMLTVLVLSGGIIIAGYINALHVRIKTVEIHIPKHAGGLKTLNAVLVSDIHLGTIVGRERFAKIADMINGLQPDIVLLAGDVIDEDIEPVVRKNIGELLRSLQARYGVFAVPGNHEYIGGAEKAFRYLREHRITLLRDSAVCVEGSFWVAGRDEREKQRFTGVPRKQFSEWMPAMDTPLPVILLDHQPFGFDDAVQHGVDLQLSGHTHYGQLWPFHYITGLLYEKDWGYLKKGHTHFYVSCGAGTWGPPVRTVSRPEIVHLKISFL
jgi:uncharacterized protein